MEKPSLKEAFKFWLKLGFISFGGPAGQISIMHEFLVEKKKWISESRFLHALNYCMVLPGPEAQQLATYTGWLLNGFRGGLMAGSLFILPSMFILMGLSSIYVSFGNIPWIYSLFEGLKPAVIAIIFLALIKISSKSLKSTFYYFISAAAFVCIFFLNVPFPLIILGSIILAAISRKLLPNYYADNMSHKKEIDEHESQYFINYKTVIANTGFKIKNLAVQIFTAVVLWFIPIMLLYYFLPNSDFWMRLTVFFSQAAFVTFGGAYAVLPYVAQVSVEKFFWLSELQMIDGLALGETTPGPLVMVLAFVGFMAGFNQFGGSLAMGSLALMVTTFYTFLPCFLFIFIGAPIIERTQENLRIKELLSMVTAAVVGVILNLTIYLGKAVYFGSELAFSQFDILAFGWTVISLIALHKFKLNMILWIGISAMFGLITFLIGI
jgi:chromate transporter